LGAVPTAAQDCKLTVDSHNPSSWKTRSARAAPTDALSAAPTDKEHAGISSQSRLLILAPLALFLLWEVTTRSLVAYLADTSPETALLLQPSYSNALLKLAAAKLRVDPRFDTIEPTRRVSNFKKGSQATEDVVEDKVQPPAEKSHVGNEQNLAEIRSWTELALLNDPLNARAFRILGQLSQGGDEGQVERFMQGAFAARCRRAWPFTG
jgi:hypothetical protein